MKMRHVCAKQCEIITCQCLTQKTIPKNLTHVPSGKIQKENG